MAFYELLRNDFTHLPSFHTLQKSMGVSFELIGLDDYVLGCADVTGEVMRWVLNRLGESGQALEPILKVRNCVSDIVQGSV